MTVNTINGKAAKVNESNIVELTMNVMDFSIHMNYRKQTFLQLLTAYNVKGWYVDTMDFHIETDADLETFFLINYKGDWDNIANDIEDLQNAKLANNKMSLVEFTTAFKNNSIKAIEQFFQRKIYKCDIEKIQTQFNQGKLSPELVFSVNAKDEWYNTINKFVRANWANVAV